MWGGDVIVVTSPENAPHKTHSRGIKKLKQRRFWTTQVNRKWNVCIFGQWQWPNLRANSLNTGGILEGKKFHFRLTCFHLKRLCVNLLFHEKPLSPWSVFEAVLESSLFASVDAIKWCGFQTLSGILSHSITNFSQYLKIRLGDPL